MFEKTHFLKSEKNVALHWLSWSTQYLFALSQKILIFFYNNNLPLLKKKKKKVSLHLHNYICFEQRYMVGKFRYQKLVSYTNNLQPVNKTLSHCTGTAPMYCATAFSLMYFLEIWPKKN